MSLLLVTAVVEVAAGAGLLLAPAVVFDLLLGVSHPAPEAGFVGRVAGAALLAIGTASWLARKETGSPAGRGLLTAVLIYDAAAAALLAYAGSGLGMVGVALWPAVVLHTALGGWCAACLWW